MSFFHPWIRQFQEAISPGAHAEAGRMMYNLLYTLQIVVYLILSFRLIRQVRPVPVGLKILLSIVLLDTVVGFFAATYQFVTHSHTLDSQEISTLLSFVIIYVLTYLGIVGPQHLFYRRATGLGNSTHPSSHEAMVTRLKRLMESEKLYRDSNLKYSDIAARLGVSVRALSSVLNETLGQSFTDFINTYRVHEAQELISVRSDDTLLGIAFSSGFNSKSSFNRSFRKLTGMSPSAYAARFQNVSRT
ncbi:AraC family transcriptional regulator [bacterium]|nr:AraC family transcriptional regulator [bacterium]